MTTTVPHNHVAIIGTGFGAIATAVRLQQAAVHDFVLIEKAGDVGGVWRDNAYPGAAVDVKSHLYSLSFAQNPDWHNVFAKQPELHAYLRRTVDQFDLRRRLNLNCEVHKLHWDPVEQHWAIETANGPRTAQHVVVATGALAQPVVPDLPGMDNFTGARFHSARWDHDLDLAGKRVAVIGTGASAVQFVPEIAEDVEQLVVFQRTGNWFMPRRNRAYPPAVKWAIEHVPGLQAFRRQFMFNYCESLTLMIRHPRTWGRLGALRSAAFMRMQLRDREVRRKVWPDYTFGCKRILFSSTFLPALQRPNVEVVTERITALSERGVVTDDGREREVDCVIYGTGFRTNDFMFPMAIRGAGGHELADVWAEGAHAHLGIAIPGFPSLFVMYGPNTNTSGGSIIAYLEAQAGYIRQALALVRDRGAAAIEVRPDVEAASDADVQAAFGGTAWTRCDSWYRTPDGRIVANWPYYMRDYFERTRVLEPSEYELLEKAA
jgi:cation diffusion facilitator CzcD-associated flavoprotein CzcO